MATQMSTKLNIDYDVELEKSYKLIIHNDDTTPMDLVLFVLMEHCMKSQQEAIQITLYVHENGKMKILDGTSEYLESIKNKCMNTARKYGFMDFKLTVEEA